MALLFANTTLLEISYTGSFYYGKLTSKLLTLCLLCNFACFCLLLTFFSKSPFSKKILQEEGLSECQTVFDLNNGSELFANVI